MYKIIKLEKSPRRNKKFRVYLNNGSYYDFGLLGSQTYLNHHDKIKRDNYMIRHYGNKIEKKLIDDLKPSPALFSYYLLWGDTTDINKNIKLLNEKW